MQKKTLNKQILHHVRQAIIVEISIIRTLRKETCDKTSETAHMREKEHENDGNNDLPDCWNVKQAEMFKKKHECLVVNNKKLGCDACAKFEALNLKA